MMPLNFLAGDHTLISCQHALHPDENKIAISPNHRTDDREGYSYSRYPFKGVSEFFPKLCYFGTSEASRFEKLRCSDEHNICKQRKHSDNGSPSRKPIFWRHATGSQAPRCRKHDHSHRERQHQPRHYEVLFYETPICIEVSWGIAHVRTSYPIFCTYGERASGALITPTYKSPNPHINVPMKADQKLQRLIHSLFLVWRCRDGVRRKSPIRKLANSEKAVSIEPDRGNQSLGNIGLSSHSDDTASPARAHETIKRDHAATTLEKKPNFVKEPGAPSEGPNPIAIISFNSIFKNSRPEQYRETTQ